MVPAVLPIFVVKTAYGPWQLRSQGDRFLHTQAVAQGMEHGFHTRYARPVSIPALHQRRVKPVRAGKRSGCVVRECSGVVRGGAPNSDRRIAAEQLLYSW